MSSVLVLSCKLQQYFPKSSSSMGIKSIVYMKCVGSLAPTADTSGLTNCRRNLSTRTVRLGTTSLAGIKLITFDVTGTLLQFRKPPFQFYKEFGLKYGILVPNDEKLMKAFKEQWKLMSKEKPHFGQDWRIWWTEFVTRTFIKSDAFLINNPQERPSQMMLESLAIELIGFFSTSECMQVKPGAKELLQAFKSPTTARNLQLGIISNYDPRLHHLLRDNKLESYFNFAILSHEMQISKPSPQIFEAALGKAKTNSCAGSIMASADALHIGDNYELDYCGATAAGWNAILVGPNKDKTFGDKIPKDSMVHVPDLQSLLNYFVENGKSLILLASMTAGVNSRPRSTFDFTTGF